MLNFIKINGPNISRKAHPVHLQASTFELISRTQPGYNFFFIIDTHIFIGYFNISDNDFMFSTRL